jgi:hypothetical protein
MNRLLLLLCAFITISFGPPPAVRSNGCYKSSSEDHTITGRYYLRFYNDGTVIEYEQPNTILVNFDSRTLGKILQKEGSEKFPVKQGQYFIKESAIKITLTQSNETVTYEGTVSKYTLKVQRHSNRTNNRTDMELSFQKLAGK